MYSQKLKQLPTRVYKNNGQHAEQTVRYSLTGRIEKADNKPFYMSADCLNLQIKSARATICKGTDIIKHIAQDKATAYAYVSKDFTKMYVMTPTEYIEFASKFSCVGRDSSKNGGATKLRFNRQFDKIEEYLKECCKGE